VQCSDGRGIDGIMGRNMSGVEKRLKGICPGGNLPVSQSLHMLGEVISTAGPNNMNCYDRYNFMAKFN